LLLYITRLYHVGEFIYDVMQLVFPSIV